MRRLLFLRLLVPIAALCGCGLFTASAFPGYLTLVSGQVSLPEISKADAHQYTLSSVSTAAGELVFLATSQSVSGTALYVMDGNLNVLRQFTHAELVTLHAGPLPFATRAILDAAGDVVILGLKGTPTAAGLAAIANLGESPDAGNFGFADAPKNIAGFSMSGDQMSYYIYSPWGSGSVQVGFPITGNGTMSFEILDVRADPRRTDAILVLEEMNSSLIYYVPLSRADIIGAGPAFPFILYWPWFTTSHFDRDRLGYTQDGFIGLEWGNNSTTFVRFDMTGARTSSLDWGGPTDIQISTRNAGGWFYIYDRQARMVRRINAWW
jgi:hypothetical protein